MRVLSAAILLAWPLASLPGLSGLAQLAGGTVVLVQSADADIAPADRAAIQDVIRRQIAAFQHDDAATAFGFASPGIQQQVGTPEAFLGMVQDRYRPVYRPRSTVFGPLGMQDGQIVQQVEVVGPDGRAALALYSMERQADGSWRISGCVLTESRALAT